MKFSEPPPQLQYLATQKLRLSNVSDPPYFHLSTTARSGLCVCNRIVYLC
uniref:Uncharacterized protein n=1 Tax=Rhizophagus irregularis (strain DAOM 181602 / DAOM 197198 / MUCL 43194) TaxID=747089 RepID=U9SKM3_RHIID